MLPRDGLRETRWYKTNSLIETALTANTHPRVTIIDVSLLGCRSKSCSLSLELRPAHPCCTTDGSRSSMTWGVNKAKNDYDICQASWSWYRLEAATMDDWDLTDIGESFYPWFLTSRQILNLHPFFALLFKMSGWCNLFEYNLSWLK